MRIFQQSEVREAMAHAAAGGQALHLHRIIPNRRTAPRCFVAAVDRGEDIAHLFDLDRERLIATARRCGVQVVHIDREGQAGQHIDLCGVPLRKAVAACDSLHWLPGDDRGGWYAAADTDRPIGYGVTPILNDGCRWMFLNGDEPPEVHRCDGVDDGKRRAEAHWRTIRDRLHEQQPSGEGRTCAE